MAEDYLTLEETHALLRHIEKNLDKFIGFLAQYGEHEEKSVPLVVERVANILQRLDSIGSQSVQVAMDAATLAKEIEDAGSPPVVVIPDDPTGHSDEDSTEQVIEAAAQAAQEPAQANGQPEPAPTLRIRPAQRKMLYAMSEGGGSYNPTNSNEKRTADALVGKGLARRISNGKIALSNYGASWLVENEDSVDA